jgi:hypothetical protein
MRLAAASRSGTRSSHRQTYSRQSASLHSAEDLAVALDTRSARAQVAKAEHTGETSEAGGGLGG